MTTKVSYKLKQTLVRISLPEGVSCYSTDFREHLAKTNALPSEFFHYGDEIECWNKPMEFADGKRLPNEAYGRERIIKKLDKPVPLNGRPPIRIIGGKSWLGVLAEPGKENILLPHIGTILNCATKIANSAVKIEIEQPEFGITYTDSPMKYMLRDMAVFRRTEVAQNKPIEQVLKERIWGGMTPYGATGIDGTVGHFNLMPCTPEELDLKVVVLKNVGMKMRSADGLSNEFMSLVNAEVWMNAKLNGIWQVGNLTSRGYGRLIRQIGGNSK